MRTMLHYTDRYNANMPGVEVVLTEQEWLDLYRTGKHQDRMVSAIQVQHITIPTKVEPVPGLA